MTPSATSPPVALLLAKAPVPGQVKTRLARHVGADAAAHLAAAALRDSIEACEAAFGPARCYLALSGDLTTAVDGDELVKRLSGWRLLTQRGATFADRLARAHEDVAALAAAPVVQIGMDTPQVLPEQLTTAARSLHDADAVLGPAEDGGWWVLGLAQPRLAAGLRRVPMSTAKTYEATRRVLEETGARVATTITLRDIDDRADAEAVAAEIPTTLFATRWRRPHSRREEP
jgi:uncharacterized protein